MSDLVSAIPAHLASARTYPGRTPHDFRPPYPSYTARFDPVLTRVVMAYFGVQWIGDNHRVAREAVVGLCRELARAAGSPRIERARYLDERGYETEIVIGYWGNDETFNRWFTEIGSEWTAPRRHTNGIGFFVEVLHPEVRRFETLFSAVDRLEGVARISETLSGEIREHGYWGGMRDRLPIAAESTLEPSGTRSVTHDGPRTRVHPVDNLCLIRSGQDWTDADGDERALYLNDVEPVLRTGMDFLRDSGRPLGCFANRYMTVLSDDGDPLDKTFGMSWWRSLGDLERWAESHPTHVAIFGAALRYLSTLGPAATLRLYHEVTVAAADEQFFEYLGCHDETGMLASTSHRSGAALDSEVVETS